MPRGGNRPGAGRPKLDKTPRLLCFDPKSANEPSWEPLESRRGIVIKDKARRLPT